MTAIPGLRTLGGRPWRAALLVIGIVGLFALSGIVPFGTGHSSASPPAVSHDSAATLPIRPPTPTLRTPTLPHSSAPAAEPTSARAPLSGQPGTARPGGSSFAPSPPSAPSSGRGLFFTSTSLPQPANATLSYPTYGYPLNDTSSPSIAVSSTGDAVLAYTAFTNESPCANSTPFAWTEVGLVASTSNGSSWSSPVYLGNPDCSQAYNYTSAWQPSVAVLANGTFALAYIEYNASPYLYSAENLPDSAYPDDFIYDQLVITFSYDNGTTWTDPTPMNTSVNLNYSTTYRTSLPEVPVLAATGQTLYLLWENYTDPSFYYDGSIGLNMVVSTAGGANGTWGAPITFPVHPGTYFGEFSWVDTEPNVLIGPGGELFVAYDTNFSETPPPNCQAYGCSNYYFDTLDVVVASSVNNGSTITMHTVAHSLPQYEFYPGEAFMSTEPQLAYDPGSGHLYVAYEAMMFPTSCFTIVGSNGCYIDAPAPWISVSSNLGTTWSTPKAISFALDNPYGGVYDVNLNLGLAVNATGAVFVSDLFTNNSQCIPYLYGGLQCGLTSGVMLISTDGGGNFTGPYTVSPGTFGDEYWAGTSSVFATLNGTLTSVWANPNCPGFATIGYCYWGSGDGFVNITLSQEFTGSGVTVTFNETGLPSGVNWTATLTGNARSGPAGTNLTVSGVPSGPNETWSADWLNTTYGNAYGVTLTPTSPGAITANTTINASYDPYALLNIFTVPPAQSGEPFACVYSYGYGDDCGNEEVQPFPGGHWVPVGGTAVYNITGGQWPNYCYTCYNYTFLAWSGTGWGSWNTTNPNGSSVVRGPVNETASFNFLSTCDNFFGSISCTNATYNYLFQETGLPSGTTWAVTFNGTMAQGNLPLLAFSAGQGPYNFTVWNVPFNATWSWVGTANYASPITSLQGATEQVHFLLVPDSTLTSGVSFGARGLPGGVASWSLLLNNTSYGIPLTNSTFELASGNYTLNATDVYGPNDVGGYLSEFDVTPLSLNLSAYTVAPGGAVDIVGPTEVTAVFAPEYFVTVSWSGGGSVSPGTVGWTHSGAGVLLTATPEANYAFVDWTGSGAGAVSGTTAAITIDPTAPVTEFAAFTAVVPTYRLTVSAHGLLAGVPVTLTVGTETYTQLAPFNVSGLLAGSYSIAVPTVYPNGTVGVRYDPTSVTSSLSLSDGALDVTENGTLSIAYAASYALTVTPSVNGTTSPASGTLWDVAGTPVALVATPTAGHSFAGWVGIGPGSITSANASVMWTPTGPVTESAYFSTNPYVPPATFTLTVTETGLPAGIPWSASIGSQGSSGLAGSGSTSLELTGLNGSYQLSVPTIPGATGVRYVPSYAENVSLTSHDLLVNVTFVTQYAVTVTTSAGGTATASAAWAVSGTVVTLTATANASSTFSNWTGSGTSSYTGTSGSTTITVTGPVHELATFVPTASLHATGGGSSGGSWALPIGLLVVLLVVGLVVGLLLARARPPSSGAVLSTTDTEADTSNVPVWSENAQTTETPPPPSTAAPETPGEDSIYGGGSG